MMPKEEFMQLCSGDQILIRSKRGNYKRTIVSGPADSEDGKAITLPIRNKSWTGRAYTVCFWNDIKHRIIKKLSSRADMLANGDEILLLLNWCPKPSTLIAREIREAKSRPCRSMKNKRIMEAVIKTHRELKGVGL